MTEPRKHHYLPQFYLRNFSENEKQVVQFEKTKEARSFGTSIGDAAAVRDYHRIDHDEAEDPFALERFLSQVEGIQASLLNEVINKGVESSSLDRGDLVFFISLMRLRVPPVKRFFESSLREIVRSTGHILSRKGKLPSPPAGLEKELSPENWNITISNWKILHHMFLLAVDTDVLSILERMNISILRTNGQDKFITCDQPVAEFHPHAKASDSEGRALADPLIQLSLPISHHLMLYLSWDKEQTPESPLTIEQVREFNRRTIISAENYVFSSDNDPSVKTLIKLNYGNNAGFELSDALDVGDSFYHISRFKSVMGESEYKITN